MSLLVSAAARNVYSKLYIRYRKFLAAAHEHQNENKNKEREREARERENKATRERHTKKLASLAPKKKGSFGVNGSFDRPPGVAIVSLRVIVGDGLESYTNGIHRIVIRKCAVAS